MMCEGRHFSFFLVRRFADQPETDSESIHMHSRMNLPLAGVAGS
jgi:hypothetical protein